MNPQKVKKKISIIVLFFIMFSIIPVKSFAAQMPIDPWDYIYMAEWHFYASGPSKTNKEKLWTTGTEKEKQIIIDKINLELDWQKKTGIPTWVGAWMPGNYNDGNDYSVEEQAVFAKFVSSELEKAKIPFAVNNTVKAASLIEGSLGYCSISFVMISK